MKSRILCVCLVLMGLTGCDGRGKILYLQPATAMKPPWSVASVVIPIEGGEDVVGIVAKIASDLGLFADPLRMNRWWTTTTYSNTFTLLVTKTADGCWAISLMDWPTTARSQQSLKAEEMIRNATNRPIQPPQAKTANSAPDHI